MSSEIFELLKNFRLELKKDIEERRMKIVNDIKAHIRCWIVKSKLLNHQCIDVLNKKNNNNKIKRNVKIIAS